MNADSVVRSRTISTIGLGVFLALCYFRLELGSYVTATTVETWYRGLNKASFNPSDSVFTPVWIILFFLMALSGWRVWRYGNSRPVIFALALFSFQLGLNFLWSILFFGFQLIGLALAEMIMLFLTVTLMILVFWRIDHLAAFLMIPYVVWLIFVTILTYYILILNWSSDSNLKYKFPSRVRVTEIALSSQLPLTCPPLFESDM